MKMTFKCEHDYEGQPKATVTMETDAVVLSDILQDIESFLKGCGFHFDGELVIDSTNYFTGDNGCQENLN